MSLPKPHRTLLTLICIIAGFMSACQIEERELLSWQNDDYGHLKIASYIVDVNRPIESRKKGISILAKGRHYDDILSVYQHLTKLEQGGEAEAAFFTEELITFIDKTLSKTSPEQQTVAAELSFFLMSLEAPRQAFAIRNEITSKLTKWSLGYIRSGREVIVPSQKPGMSKVKEAHIKPQDILLSLLHVTSAVDQSKGVFDLVKEDMAENIAKTDYILRIHKVVHDLRSPSITEQMAVALLAAARKSYPESITEAMVEAMIENKNHTLIKFLIEIGRDRRVPFTTLKMAIDKAANGADELGINDEVIPLFVRVLKSPTAHAQMIFRALRWSWEFSTKEGQEISKDKIKEFLMSITPDFSVPVSGTDLKKEVENFCIQFVEPKKDKVRELLLELIRELKDKQELWPARLYTLSCINQLYPDDFPKVMKRGGLYKRYYQKDQKRISAWRSDGDVTLGSITDEFMNPMR